MSGSETTGFETWKMMPGSATERGGWLSAKLCFYIVAHAAGKSTVVLYRWSNALH